MKTHGYLFPKCPNCILYTFDHLGKEVKIMNIPFDVGIVDDDTATMLAPSIVTIGLDKYAQDVALNDT